MIQREIEEKIKQRFNKGKAIILIGPRQAGKTTLIKKICPFNSENTIWLSGDDSNDNARLKHSSIATLKTLIGNNRFLIIDEAQRIENIGLTIKLIIDHIENIQVIATGSSAFDLANQVNEPLTGRKYEFTLLPFSFSELSNHSNSFAETSNLENRLIFGSYPEVVISPGEEKELLNLLSDSYLYKDLLSYDNIKKASLLTNLLKALALQIGSEVNYNELGKIVGADNGTIERYVDALEKAFIVFRLTSLSRNVRNELKKSKKIYFYDNGIRNAIIGNYLPLANRNDKGALFENYLISERKKQLLFNNINRHSYFWRTTQQQEIDYLEEYDGIIDVYEFKWNKVKTKIPLTFLKNYPVNQNKTITSENYFEWLLQNP